MNLSELNKQAEKANNDFNGVTDFLFEYQRKGIIIKGDFVANCYILKEAGDIEHYGTAAECLDRMQELGNQMVN